MSGKTPFVNSILVYTRKPQGEYTESLANSVHFAVSGDGERYEPLNRNYGILFAQADISRQDTLVEKGVKAPYLFRMRQGGFGVIAAVTDKLGNIDEKAAGKVLLWTTDDFIDFTERGLVDLRELTETEGISYPCEPIESPLPGIVAGNALSVKPEEIAAAYLYWTPIRHVKNIIPDNIAVSSAERLNEVKITAVYSDGSTAEKAVDWDCKNINFSVSGDYEIKGRLRQTAYPFPLAKGYADPVILPRDGKYYYIATNDNTNDVGLFVRVSHTIAGLFAEGHNESLILDKDEEKGFIKTFWAPEFHEIGGELYILFAVGGERWAPQCHLMKLKKGGDITRAEDWETPVRVKKADGSFLTDDGITLDMTYFKVAGRSYYVWSYRKGIGTPLDTGSMLYIAEADENNPDTLLSEPVLLSRPLLSWENMQGTINNEGPYPLITEDTVYIAYSGGAAGGYTYSIGLLSIPRGGDFLNAASWKKRCTPALNYYCIDKAYGAGHNSFFTDHNGNVMIAYHAEETITPSGERCTGMHRVHFRQDGSPALDVCGERDINSELAEVTVIARCYAE